MRQAPRGHKGSLLTIDQTNGTRTTLCASYGAVPDSCRGEDKGCCDRCFRLDRLTPQATPLATASAKDSEHALCFPLSFKGRYSGRLCVFGKVVREEGVGLGFTVDDRNLLSTMVSMISSALENALTFQKVEELAQCNEEMVGALATLFEISSVLMTTVDLNQTMYIVPSAATHPAGLDHDRALLFLTDDEAGALRPVAEIDKEHVVGPHRELILDLNDLRWRQQKLPLFKDKRLAALTVLLGEGRDVLASTVAEKRAILVEDPADDPLVSPDLLAALGPHPFVSVPCSPRARPWG